MYIIMDMGTTNTRLYLCRQDKLLDQIKGAFGAGFGKKHGREALLARAKELLETLLHRAGIQEQDVECVLAVGMAGSEIGLWEVPHIPVPADARSLADAIHEERFDGVDIPFLFVPGVKKTDGALLVDMMRGEEVETIGLADLLSLTGDGIFLLPGTHNKIVCVEAGRILDLYTTFSGELLDALISNTILAGQAAHDFQIVEAAVRSGASYTEENGLNAAAYRVRVMAKNGEGIDACSSFLYGSVFSQDVALIRRVAQGKPVYIAGRKALRDVYAILLGGDAVPLEDEVCAQMLVRGAMQIKEIRDIAR